LSKTLLRQNVAALAEVIGEHKGVREKAREVQRFVLLIFRRRRSLSVI